MSDLKVTSFSQLKSSSYSYSLVTGYPGFWQVASPTAHSGTNKCIYSRKQQKWPRGPSQKNSYRNMINPL